MLARLTAAALLLLAIPASAQISAPCVVQAASWDGIRYAVDIPHEAVTYGHAYTAEPPAEIIAQHYITATVVITLPNTSPPITTTVQTFAYSETTAPLGYAPFIARESDYAYFVRSDSPFQAWDCAPSASAHIFLPLAAAP